MNDLSTVLNKSGAELILISHENVRRQVGHDHFIKQQACRRSDIGSTGYNSRYGDAERYTLLAGIDPLNLSVADFDEENDPITERKFLYVHDPDYFDNGSGVEPLAQSVTPRLRVGGHPYHETEQAGQVYHLSEDKDDPSADPAFDSFDRYSGTPFVEVYAHRKPVARALLDWDYDMEENEYRTTWVDNSYDPDHQYSRADKGIVERKIMYREAGGEWFYTIPDKLKPGRYELYYYVRDPENTWSDPFVMDFMLEEAPPIQFDASLRAYDRVAQSWASLREELEAYDIRTRYREM